MGDNPIPAIGIAVFGGMFLFAFYLAISGGDVLGFAETAGDVAPLLLVVVIVVGGLFSVASLGR